MALPKTFKPEQGSSGRYTLTGLKSGEKVKIRVLSYFVAGRSVWSDTDDGKRVPFRARETESIPVGKIGINQFTQMPERIKQFLAAVVWNYTTGQVEIFETDKSTIIEAIYELEQSEDWGDMKGYDVSISKSGQNMDTKYTVLPSGQGAFKEKADWKSVNLEALFDGTDPFSSDKSAKPEKTEAEVVSDSIPF